MCFGTASSRVRYGRPCACPGLIYPPVDKAEAADDSMSDIESSDGSMSGIESLSSCSSDSDSDGYVADDESEADTVVLSQRRHLLDGMISIMARLEHVRKDIATIRNKLRPRRIPLEDEVLDVLNSRLHYLVAEREKLTQRQRSLKILATL
jgi:hypothetical protein